jgi:L-lactate permease
MSRRAALLSEFWPGLGLESETDREWYARIIWGTILTASLAIAISLVVLRFVCGAVFVAIVALLLVLFLYNCIIKEDIKEINEDHALVLTDEAHERREQ